MHIGFARVDITPPLGVHMGGQVHPPQADSIESNLYANAMCVRDDGVGLVIISCDLVSIPTTMADQIRGGIAARLSMPSENVLIAATHTHSGPLTGAMLGGEKESDYVETLPAKIEEAACEAQGALQEARLTVTSTEVKGLAFNRRSIMRNGTIQTHPLKNDPDIVELEGPDDPELGIIYATDPSGRFLGGIVNFTCHATVMERYSTAISADYPGCVSSMLAEELNSDSTVLFLNGACGNICQVDIFNQETHEVGAAWAKHMGRTIAGAAAEAIRFDAGVEQTGLRVLSDTLAIPMRPIPPKVVREAKAKAAKPVSASPLNSDYGTERFGELPAGRVALVDLIETDFWAWMEARQVLALAEEYEKNPLVKVPVSVITGVDFALACVPCELFVEFGLEIKAKSPFKYTFVSELTNGAVGYIPTEKAFSREGGYEARFPARLRENAGRLITDKVMELLGPATD